MSAAVLLAAALAATPGSAAERPRICVFGVKGDGAAALVDQLSRTLCEDLACVAPESVRSGGKLDFVAVRAQGVAGVLFGTATRSGKSPRLVLALLTTSFSPQRTWTLPLDARGRVEGPALAGLASELRDELAGAAPERPVVRVEPIDPEREAPVAQRTVASVSSPPAPARGAGAVAASPVAPVREARPRWAAVDLGMAYTHRELRYSGVAATPATLLGVRSSVILSPAVRVEVSPLVGAAGEWYQGATASAGYSRSVGLYTEAPSGSNRSTTFSHLEVGAGLRFRPIAAWRASLLADLSYQSLVAKVSPTGAIRGLPDTDLSGVRAGALLEAPLTRGWALLAGAGLTYWLSAGDLVGSRFFSSGSAWGVDASGGVSLDLRPPFSVRVLVDWARTSYALSGTSVYRATGASDVQVGARVLARAAF